MVVTWRSYVGSATCHQSLFSSQLTKQLQQADIRTRPSVDDEIVQHLERLHWPSGEAHDLLFLFPLCLGFFLIFVWFRSLQCLPPFSIHLTDQDVTPGRLDGLSFLPTRYGCLFRRDGAIDRARESHPQIDSDTIVDGLVERLGVVGEIKVGQEAKGTQGKWKNRWNDPLEQPRGEQDRAISSELGFREDCSVTKPPLRNPTQPRLTVTTISNRCG
jgi:hypothetical protein